MIIERTGDLGNFINNVTSELFSGDLGEGEQYIFRINLLDESDYIIRAKELLHKFYRDRNFELTDNDSDVLLHTVINKLYSTKTMCDSFTLLSNGKISCVNIMVQCGEILKISAVINRLDNSVTWETRDRFYKDLHVDDLLIRRTTDTIMEKCF